MRNFKKALLTTNAQFTPELPALALLSLLASESFLRFNRSLMYHGVDLEQELHSQVQTGRLSAASLTSEINDKFDGDIVSWYMTSARNEIKMLALAHLYSESLLGHAEREASRTRKADSPESGLAVEWTSAPKLVQQDWLEESLGEQNSFSFDSVAKENFTSQEFEFLRQKYKQNFS